ncbi:alpha/beta fold hydrolase [Amaricoccus macauensis]|uniref:alpha/beta fold hydrolase n=1 Tax=Amaricoccus macauensis TaxID=57001 RepID=UPI003C7E8E04
MLARTIAAICLAAATSASAQTDLPESFDYMGPTVSTLDVAGRTVAYVDTGPDDAIPVLFLGGTGTSAAVVGLADFLRTMREDLGLRLVSVGRAGFGQSAPAENWTFSDYPADAVAVLDELGITGEVSVMAISGGGPYAAAFAAAYPDRIRSVHLAAALALATRSPLCDDPARMKQIMDDYAAHPLKWWGFPEDSPTHDIPGFGTAAADDGARTFGIAGQRGSGAAEVAEYMRYCKEDLPDVSSVNAPVYIYQGLRDMTVPPANADKWEEAFPNIAVRRNYENGAHDVQYRHWDQILVDMAHLVDRIVICHDGSSMQAAREDADAAIDEGARLGICAWPE